MLKKIKIFDTTLRDGLQAPENSLSSQKKLELFRDISTTNVDIIEIGFPASSDSELNSCIEIRKDNPEMMISVFSRAIQADIDKAFEALKPIKNHQIQIALSGSDIHLNHKRKISRNDSINEAIFAINYAKSLGFTNISAAFEDATRGCINYLSEIIKSCISNGANTIVLADTVGYSQPVEIQKLVSTIRNEIGDNIDISIHCHNDMGLATANSLAAIEAGASVVQTTFCGIGERAGNTPIEEIITSLYIRKDIYNVSSQVILNKLPDVCYKTYELINQVISRNKTIIGRNAYATEAGIHGKAIINNPITYEAFNPAIFGLNRKFVLGKYSGEAMIEYMFKQMKVDLPKDGAKLISSYLKKSKSNRTYTDQDITLLKNLAINESKLSQGVRADHSAKVDISKVGNGYFSSEDNALLFINLGIKPILEALPKNLNIVDFGGGNGYLLKKISTYIKNKGYYLSELVVDANPTYLKEAKELGLNTLEADISSVQIEDKNLIFMRSVNHYNSLNIQVSILNNVYRSLKVRGYLISQVLSGFTHDCEIISSLMNHPHLGRAKSSNDFHITSAEEYKDILKDAGFRNIKIVGHAPTTVWTPEENLWLRFNKSKRDLYIKENDLESLSKLDLKHNIFINDANEAIKNNQNDTRFVETDDGSHFIDLQFPIIIAQK